MALQSRFNINIHIINDYEAPYSIVTPTAVPHKQKKYDCHMCFKSLYVHLRRMVNNLLSLFPTLWANKCAFICASTSASAKWRALYAARIYAVAHEKCESIFQNDYFSAIKTLFYMNQYHQFQTAALRLPIWCLRLCDLILNIC